MTNQELKEKYHFEKGIRWYENMADYANWLEDALIQALRQPPVVGRSEQLVCEYCNEDANPTCCDNCLEGMVNAVKKGL
jgi:hypothetical protein